MLYGWGSSIISVHLCHVTHFHHSHEMFLHINLFTWYIETKNLDDNIFLWINNIKYLFAMILIWFKNKTYFSGISLIFISGTGGIVLRSASSNFSWTAFRFCTTSLISSIILIFLSLNASSCRLKLYLYSWIWRKKNVFV